MREFIHLWEYEADSSAISLNSVFNPHVEIPRMRHDKQKTLAPLIDEEALLSVRIYEMGVINGAPEL